MKCDTLMEAYQAVYEDHEDLRKNNTVGTLKPGDGFADKKLKLTDTEAEERIEDDTDEQKPNKVSSKVEPGENLPDDLEEPEESEEFSAYEKISKRSMVADSLFNKIFRRTLTEETEDFDSSLENPLDDTSTVDDFENVEDEVNNLIDDLNSLKDKIDDIIDRLEGEIADMSEEDVEDEESFEDENLEDEESLEDEVKNDDEDESTVVKNESVRARNLRRKSSRNKTRKKLKSKK